MNLKACQVKQWDKQHAKHGMSQASVARSVVQGKERSMAVAAVGRDALCILMQAAFKQLDGAPKTLQAFADALM